MKQKANASSTPDADATEAPTHEVIVPMKHDKNYEPGERITLTEADVAALPAGTVKALAP